MDACHISVTQVLSAVLPGPCAVCGSSGDPCQASQLLLLLPVVRQMCDIDIWPISSYRYDLSQSPKYTEESEGF